MGEAFYAEHSGKGFFAELVAFMTSGPLIALKLEKRDAISAWRSLMGPTNFETAQKEAPKSIRALYGSSMTKNASHDSDSLSSAVRELQFYFAPQQTLALIKPDAVSAGNAAAIIQRIGGFYDFGPDLCAEITGRAGHCEVAIADGTDEFRGGEGIGADFDSRAVRVVDDKERVARLRFDRFGAPRIGVFLRDGVECAARHETVHVGAH